MGRPFKVRDFRKKGFFVIDDAYLNGYARFFPHSVTLVYLSLCRHADKEQSSFPAQELIAKQHNMNVRTVRRAIKALLEANIIAVKRERSKKGTWMRNTYYLLDKTEWLPPDKITPKKTRGHQCPMDKPEDISDQTRGHQSPIKDTHKKDTHNNSQAVVNKNVDKSILLEKLGFETKRGGATYEWQDKAARYWKALGLNGSPSSSWFKLFKKAYQANKGGVLDATFASVADAEADNPEKYFYKVFNVKLNKWS